METSHNPSVDLANDQIDLQEDPTVDQTVQAVRDQVTSQSKPSEVLLTPPPGINIVGTVDLPRRKPSNFC